MSIKQTSYWIHFKRTLFCCLRYKKWHDSQFRTITTRKNKKNRWISSAKLLTEATLFNWYWKVQFPTTYFYSFKRVFYEKANFKQINCMCCIIFHAIDYNLNDVYTPGLHLLIDLFWGFEVTLRVPWVTNTSLSIPLKKMEL